jgi:hypothetical protein
LAWGFKTPPLNETVIVVVRIKSHDFRNGRCFPATVAALAGDTAALLATRACERFSQRISSAAGEVFIRFPPSNGCYNPFHPKHRLRTLLDLSGE